MESTKSTVSLNNLTLHRNNDPIYALFKKQPVGLFGPP